MRAEAIGQRDRGPLVVERAVTFAHRRGEERPRDLRALDDHRVAAARRAVVHDLGETAHGGGGVAGAGEGDAGRVQQTHDHRAGRRRHHEAGHGLALGEADVEDAVRTAADVGGQDLVILLELRLDRAHVARGAFRVRGEETPHHVGVQEAVGLEAEAALGRRRRRRALVDHVPQQPAEQREEKQGQHDGQARAHRAAPADGVARHGIHGLRDERAPIAVLGAGEGLGALAEESSEEAHVRWGRRWRGRGRARACGARARGSPGPRTRRSWASGWSRSCRAGC